MWVLALIACMFLTPFLIIGWELFLTIPWAMANPNHMCVVSFCLPSASIHPDCMCVAKTWLNEWARDVLNRCLGSKAKPNHMHLLTLSLMSWQEMCSIAAWVKANPDSMRVVSLWSPGAGVSPNRMRAASTCLNEWRELFLTVPWANTNPDHMHIVSLWSSTVGVHLDCMLVANT